MWAPAYVSGQLTTYLPVAEPSGSSLMVRRYTPRGSR